MMDVTYQRRVGLLSPTSARLLRANFELIRTDAHWSGPWNGPDGSLRAELDALGHADAELCGRRLLLDALVQPDRVLSVHRGVWEQRRVADVGTVFLGPSG